MTTVSFYSDCLPAYERALLNKEWPIPRLPDVDFNLDIGVDPSMSSSGICIILRRKTDIIKCLTLNHKTRPGSPTPIRLGSLIDAINTLIDEILSDIPSSKLHITILSEIPPVAMSSSGWLFALCQMLWIGFGPDAPALHKLHQRGFSLNITQFGIGVPQLKNIYLHWASQSTAFESRITFKEVSKQKSLVVKIVNQVIDQTPLRPFLPKRFNNDVAEGIALALCAGGCADICSYDLSEDITCVSPIIPVKLLHSLMVNQKVNKQNQRMGWVYRPLEYSFGWVAPA